MTNPTETRELLVTLPSTLRLHNAQNAAPAEITTDGRVASR
jgi:hypothetical protein